LSSKDKKGASKYNKRVEVWGKTKKENAVFETTYEDKKLKTIWAQIVPQTGKLQAQQADTVLSNTSHKIVCRYNAGKSILIDNWLVYNGERYDINYLLNPYEANEEIEIFVEKLKG